MKMIHRTRAFLLFALLSILPLLSACGLRTPDALPATATSPAPESTVTPPQPTATPVPQAADYCQEMFAEGWFTSRVGGRWPGMIEASADVANAMVWNLRTLNTMVVASRRPLLPEDGRLWVVDDEDTDRMTFEPVAADALAARLGGADPASGYAAGDVVLCIFRGQESVESCEYGFLSIQDEPSHIEHSMRNVALAVAFEPESGKTVLLGQAEGDAVDCPRTLELGESIEGPAVTGSQIASLWNAFQPAGEGDTEPGSGGFPPYGDSLLLVFEEEVRPYVLLVTTEANGSAPIPFLIEPVIPENERPQHTFFDERKDVLRIGLQPGDRVTGLSVQEVVIERWDYWGEPIGGERAADYATVYEMGSEERLNAFLGSSLRPVGAPTELLADESPIDEPAYALELAPSRVPVLVLPAGE